MKIITRVWRISRSVWTWGIIVVLGLGLFGQLVRDRAVWLALSMYLPILPVGVVGLVQDLVQRGKAMPRVRFGLAMLSIVAVAWSAGRMTGGGRGVQPSSEADQTIRLVQWNVMWGTLGKEARWKTVVEDIAEQKPDIVVLSEGPSEPFREMLLERLGGDWSVAVSKNSMRTPGYWYNMMVCARWPVEKLDERGISSGRTMVARVRAPGGSMRVLMVDGASDPLWPRPARLLDVARAVHDADERHGAIDIVAGDFNTISRSVGFEQILRAGAGFERASDRARWRGTWPAMCPLYDIDHVLISRRWRTWRCEMFNNAYLDHRAQLVRFERVK